VPSLEYHRPSMEMSLFKPFEFKFLKNACWPVFAAMKGLALFFQLSFALMSCSRADVIIVQNPPSLPTLPVVAIVGYLRGSRVIVDWHNLGWTVIALALGARRGFVQRAIVGMCRILEGWCARRATAHMCVTCAMQQFLLENVGVRATTLHDRPPVFFSNATTTRQRHDLFVRLRSLFEPAEKALGASTECSGSGTLFTEKNGSGEISLRQNRPALLISSTSWTADEDFGILLASLRILDSDPSIPFTASCVIHELTPLLTPLLGALCTGSGRHRERPHARILRGAGCRVAPASLLRSNNVACR